MTRPVTNIALTTSAVLFTALTACGSDDNGGGNGNGDVKCDQETRADEYVAGMSKSGDDGFFDAVLVEATPAPPDKDNTWVVDLVQAGGGSPVDNADIAVVPFMPDHGHGTPVTPVVTATGEPGQYRIEQINLWMPGYWEVTLEVTAAGSSDEIVFAFCIEG